MYDKVRLVLYADSISEFYNWCEVLERIQPVLYRADYSGGKGIWRGRRITANEKYISFEGSLPKSLYHHNLKTLSLKEVEECIMQLSKDLNIPMYLATVEEVEIAHNFTLNHPPILYLKKLNGPKNFKERTFETTKYIEGDGVSIKFYDKIKEAKKKRELPKYNREELPSNLLRYEVTFPQKKLIQIFDREIKANDLWNKYVFWNLVAEWFEYYNRIEKLPNNCWDIKFHNFKCPKDFIAWCICCADSVQNLYDYIKNEIFKYRENPRYEDRILHQQIKNWINKAQKWKKANLISSPLTEELTNKIDEFITYLEKSNDGFSIEEEKQLFSFAS